MGDDVVAAGLGEPCDLVGEAPADELVAELAGPLPEVHVVVGEPEEPASVLPVEVLHLVGDPPGALAPLPARPEPPLAAVAAVVAAAPRALHDGEWLLQLGHEGEVVALHVLGHVVIGRVWEGVEVADEGALGVVADPIPLP